MLTTGLHHLQQHTIIVADTGDLAAIARLRPVDATTNPSLITAAAQDPRNAELIQQAQQQAVAEGLQGDALLNRMIDLLTVQFGVEILKLIQGRVSTEVDARLSFDTAATVAKAHELIAIYQKAGIDQHRVLIKIASTWQGIQAARQLEAEGIHCNLTLLFGLHQAIACAEAGVTLISPFVGRILDWQKKNEARQDIPIEQDAGVISVKQIYTYYKQHGYATQVMGASFRSTAQILALAGCDLLTISPNLLDELAQLSTDITEPLSVDWAAQQAATTRQSLDAEQFAAQHQQDCMSSELLQAGIDGFIKARQQLEQQLQQQFALDAAADVATDPA